ncbi:MAG TPA: hypothetical protein VN845_08970 [Solirubrobacteraceae bacterium]|nr:hypothetical protein [Solirubrobacteraceae bacterium]
MPEPAKDFRSERMPSPEGKGLARRAWDSYVNAVDKVARPPLEPVVTRIAAPLTADLLGFWLVWHLEGGFEGLRRLGMSRSAIYRRVRLFRIAFNAHPDEFSVPGVSIDLKAYHRGELVVEETEVNT